MHNGIIENYASLRKRLSADGHTFRSETDTEVAAHLIEDLLKQGADFRSAFLGALRLIEGTYGIAAVNADCPGELLVAKRGSPMVIGVGDGRDAGGQRPDGASSRTRATWST